MKFDIEQDIRDYRNSIVDLGYGASSFILRKKFTKYLNEIKRLQKQVKDMKFQLKVASKINKL